MNKKFIVYILMAGVFGILNTEMGVIGILPYLANYYEVTILQAGLLISLFAMGVAIAGPIMPLVFSRFNRKHVMLAVLLVFTACNTISIFAEDFNLLLAMRIIPAFLHPVYCALAFTVAAGMAGVEEAPKAVAKINMGVAGGMVLGVPMSNFLAEYISLTASMSFFAITTFLVMVVTAIYVPSMPVKTQLSYGAQLSVLKRPSVWVSILAILFLNGSVFGVFNYWAAYLVSEVGVTANLVSVILFMFGISNVLGSMAAGELLAKQAGATVKVFPVVLAIVYMLILAGGDNWIIVSILTAVWGILGGINANINQFWLSHAIPEAPDFANGLFLTAVNIGTVAATAVSGIFIELWGLQYVIYGGLLFVAVSGVLFWSQLIRGHRKDVEPIPNQSN